MGVLMPPLVAVIMHAWLALWSVISSAQGADALTRDDPCHSWGPPDQGKKSECQQWATKLSILLWAYLGLVLVQGYVLFLL